MRSLLSKLHKESEEGNLVLFVAIALTLGIIIVAGAIVFIKPPVQKYSTEVYFLERESYPEFVVPGKAYALDVRIQNNEKADMNYSTNITASENNITTILYSGILAVPKGVTGNFTLSYIMPDFKQSRIVVDVFNKSHEAHFYVNNELTTVKYPDTVASVDCLKNITFMPQDSFMIRAKGTFSPNMKVRINGTVVFSTIVNNTEFANFTVPYPIGKGLLDVIFDNDYVNKTANNTVNIDRNLRIDYLLVGKKKIFPIDFTAEQGKTTYAFDCMDQMENITWGLSWNGALRARIINK